MKQATLILILGLGLLCSAGAARDVVVNDGFETQHWQHWTPIGTVPSWEMFVLMFDVKAPGQFNWAFGLHTWDNETGGLEQQVYVLEGVTYTVSADFAYELC